jgi:hypothetical protein
MQQFCEGIGLAAEAQELVYKRDVGEQEYQAYKAHFYADNAAFLSDVKLKEDYRQLILYLFIRFAVDAHEAYREREIDDAIYYDTFSDIQIWCLVCKQEHGEYGLEQFNWLKEHVQLRLFRLGRLQFQPYALDREVLVNGHIVIEQNRIVLNVHIPAGEPLRPGNVEESFGRAASFFRGIAPVYICQSWLLYPQLSEILPPDSNILHFQKQFEIYDVDVASRQAEERIFGRISDDPNNYAEESSLQRSAKAYLLEGHQLGSGYGIRIASQ